MKHEIDVKFYPGWTRKAISFSIDDGHLDSDKKFMDIVEPYGIKGTFNLCSERLARMSPDEYREFYRGHEIANHCKYHPAAFVDGEEYDISDEPFDRESSDRSKLHRFDGEEGLYHAARAAGGWLRRATADAYIRLVEQGHRELEEVFGEGSIRCFIWPYGQQKNKKVMDYVHSIPYYYGDRWTHANKTPDVYFAPPTKDAFYAPARHNNILAVAAEFEALPDDGELKFFCVGIHSIDYEKADKWGDLLTFAKTYGARPEDYFYATIAEIYDYSEAVKALEITDTEIKNQSDLDLYVKIDGERRVVKAKRTIHIGE
jgi:hypothetical protein